MGSGGPRGLQIPRSGVSVRGGFDSHAFPPLLLAGLLAVAGWTPARAGDLPPLGPDTTSTAAPDTAAGGVVTVPSSPEPRATRTLPPPRRLDQPRWVMLRSLLVPGWGQAHNHAWIKAALLAAGDGSLRVKIVQDERRLRDLNGQATVLGADLTVADAQVAAAQAELAAAEAEDPPNPSRIAAAQAALLAANQQRAGVSESYNVAAGAYNSLLDASTNRRWLAAGVIVYALLDAYVDAHFRSFDVDFRIDPALPNGGTPGARLQVGWRF